VAPPLAIADAVPLAPLTTLRLGGAARHLIEAHDDATALAGVQWAEGRGLPLVVLGGGSNLVVADRGFDGVVLRMMNRGLRAQTAGGEVLVYAAAGEPWDALVETAVARGWAGLECLSGIPGLVGATPIQNVGAYGQEVAETIRQVAALERTSGRLVTLTPADCEFGYRDSMFKQRPDDYVVLGVTFALVPGGAPRLRYRELEAALAARLDGSRATVLADVREAVLTLRRRKSMLIEPGAAAGGVASPSEVAAAANRRSVGSFFTNPVLTPAAATQVVERAVAAGVAQQSTDVPQFSSNGGRVKLSAAWLIEHAGFPKGFRRGAVGISTDHALALVHHGGGTTADLLALAADIQGAVRALFGVTLAPEPVLLGVS
jgi:UDP-N-acetylmuramate dehydrogenase